MIRYENKNPQYIALLEKIEEQDRVIKSLKDEIGSLNDKLNEEKTSANWYKMLSEKANNAKKESIEMYDKLLEQVIRFEASSFLGRIFFTFKI